MGLIKMVLGVLGFRKCVETFLGDGLGGNF